MSMLFAFVNCPRSTLTIVLIAAMAICSVRLNADDFIWEPIPASGNWSNSNNWFGPNLQFPDDNTDSATISGPTTVFPTLSTNITIGELTIDFGQVRTGNGVSNFGLTVQNNAGLTGATLILDGAILEVWNSPFINDFDTDSLTIDDSSLLMRGSKVQVDGPITNQDGEIRGWGLVELNGAGNFVNDGMLWAEDGTLTVRRNNASSQIDLDGVTGNSLLFADQGTLIIELPLSDPNYDGLLGISDNSEIEIQFPWTLRTDAAIPALLGGINGPATLSGAHVTVDGAVLAGGTAILAAPSSFTNMATLTLEADTTLQFDGNSTFTDPNTIVNNSLGTSFVVNSLVNIGTGTGDFNWDGAGNTVTVVNSTGDLNIDVDSIETGAIERFDGTLIMNAGDVTVNNADGQWEFAGLLQMNDGPGNPFFASVAEVLITGDIEANGFSFLAGPKTFSGSSTVDVQGLLFLRLETVINGGTWTGDGGVFLETTSTQVNAPTTIDMPNGGFDLDGAIVSNGQLVLNSILTLNVESIDFTAETPLTPIEVNSGGRLAVNYTDPTQTWTMADDLDLNALGGGLASLHLSGADVELQGTTTVSGNSITTARIDLTGILNLAAGSTFNMNGGSFTDPNLIFESATFGGSGDLIINSNRALQAEDGALIAVDVLNRGRFEPGLSIGLVDLAGNFGQTSSGTFAAELAGTPAVDHDLLNVTGTANLDGRLIVKLIDEGNGVPALQIGDQFTLLTAAGGVIGQFDNDPISIGNGVGYQWEVIYNPNNVAIRVDSIIPNLVLGDVNGDGVVTLLDVVPFVNAINSGTYIIQADINCDGAVNLLDVNLFVTLLTG